MDKYFDSIAGEVLALDASHRLELAEMLFDSLPVVEGFADEWLDEAERRKREWDSGMVQGVAASEAMRQLREITS